MSSWTSDQHKGLIPKQLLNVDGFVAFVKSLGGRLEHEAEAVMERDTDGLPKLSRKDAHTAIKKILQHSAETDDKDVAFIAQAAMLDVEEIYTGLFRAPTLLDSVHMVDGHGSKQGLSVIKNSGEADDRSSAVGKMLQAVNGKSNAYLACLGAKKNDDETFARWKINNRPLNVYDMEHFLCKVC